MAGWNLFARPRKTETSEVVGACVGTQVGRLHEQAREQLSALLLPTQTIAPKHPRVGARNGATQLRQRDRLGAGAQA